MLSFSFIFLTSPGLLLDDNIRENVRVDKCDNDTNDVNNDDNNNINNTNNNNNSNFVPIKRF